MPVTNDETTGRTGVCRHCGAQVEEALLLKGVRLARGKTSPGIPTWRRLDRGPGSARCYAAPLSRHEPLPTAPGSSFHRDAE